MNPLQATTARSCALICVGSELLRGKINTHAATIARGLASAGLVLMEEHTVGDTREGIAAAMRIALARRPVVIVTGGLGPTFDDLTREAASEACGLPLLFSKRLLRGIQEKFRRARHARMPPANARQAYLLQGAAAIPNAVGTAPGQWLQRPLRRTKYRGQSKGFNHGSVLATRYSTLILLPGPPAELVPMLDRYVLPRLRRTFPAQPLAEAHLHVVGLPESEVDRRIRSIITREKHADFTILAHLGLVDLDLFVSDVSASLARRRMERLAKAIQMRMGKAFYGRDDAYPLEKVVRDRFVAKRMTLAVAESCTGGLLAKHLTDVPGSSRYFLGGVVAYRNAVKTRLLGVPPGLLAGQGAVSRGVAAAMAEGVRNRMGSTWGVAITGIAGPGAVSSGKPVGLVYVGLAGPGTVRALEFRFHGLRDAIRQRSVIAALDLLRSGGEKKDL